MKIRKISKRRLIDSQEDIITYLFNNCDGMTLRNLIPAEYEALLGRYQEIMRQSSTPKDLPGQQKLFGDEQFKNQAKPQI